MASLKDRVRQIRGGGQGGYTDYGAFLRGYRNRQNDQKNWVAADLNAQSTRQRNAFDRQMNPIRIGSAQHQLAYAKQADALNLATGKQRYNFDRSMNPIRLNSAQHQLDYARQADAQNLLTSKQRYRFDQNMNPVRISSAKHQLGFARKADPLKLRRLTQQINATNLNQEIAQYGFDRKTRFDDVADASKVYRAGISDPTQLENAIQSAYGNNMTIDPQTGAAMSIGPDGKKYQIDFNNPQNASTYYQSLGVSSGQTPMQTIDAQLTANQAGAYKLKTPTERQTQQQSADARNAANFANFQARNTATVQAPTQPAVPYFNTGPMAGPYSPDYLNGTDLQRRTPPPPPGYYHQ